MRILRLLVCVLAGWLVASAAQAAVVGSVVRVKGAAWIGDRAAASGLDFDAGAVLRTEAGARLEIRLGDGTDLILGENARFVVDRFAYDPAAQTGEALLRVEVGAFLATTGAIAKLPTRPIRVVTPVASVGVRGTKFWGGQLGNPLDMLLLEGAIVVETPGGRVELSRPLQGTAVTAPGAAPNPPSVWAPERRERAFRTVSFD